MNQMTDIPSEKKKKDTAKDIASASATMTMSGAPLSSKEMAAADPDNMSGKTASEKTTSGKPPVLTNADALLLHRALMAQEDGLARREDLTELHKRIVQLLQALNKALNEGLGGAMGKKAAEDRAGLTARIDTLEESVNRMEGALRIEFEPVLRRAIGDVMAEQVKPKRRVGQLVFWTCLALAAGCVLGSAFHAELSAQVQQIVSWLATKQG